MKKLALTLVFGILGIGGYGQTIKSLGYNTTNGQVVYSGTNILTFTNDVEFNVVKIHRIKDIYEFDKIDVTESILFNSNAFVEAALEWGGSNINVGLPIYFLSNAHAAVTRTNLGLGTAATVSSDQDLGSTNDVTFNSITFGPAIYSRGTLGWFDNQDDTASMVWKDENGSPQVYFINDGTVFFNLAPIFNAPSQTRANLGLGATWLTNTNVTNFRTDIGLGSNNNVMFNSLSVSSGSASSPSISIGATNAGLYYSVGGPNRLYVSVDGSTGIYFTPTTLSAPNIVGDLNGGVAIGAGKSLSFSGGANIAGSRTNLGLGGGITTNRTFVAYNGTNYTTNTVTISNGIITGWTQ